MTIYGHIKPLKERNVGVVIRDEQELSRIRLREEKAKASHKGKENANSFGKGKRKIHECDEENVALYDNVISKATLAQRVRRERERNDVGGSKRQSAQRLRREVERSGESSPSRHPTLFPSLPPNRRRRAYMERRHMTTNVIQSSSLSVALQQTSSDLVDPPLPIDDMTIYGHVDGALQQTIKLLKERNVGVVIRDEQELNRIRLREAKANQKGKRKVQEGVEENVDWDEIAGDFQKINTASLLKWGHKNKIVVHVPHSGLWIQYICIDTQTFWRVMKRKYFEQRLDNL